MGLEVLKENVIKTAVSAEIESVAKRFEEACESGGFTLLGKIDIGEKLRKKEEDYQGECIIFELCDPKAAAEMLNDDTDVASLLPCRIALTQADAREPVKISSILPTSQMGLVDERLLSDTKTLEIDTRIRSVITTLASEFSRAVVE